LYESTKSSSTLPLENRSMFRCSSTVENAASCVRVPSLRVSRTGRVTPVGIDLLFTILAVSRNSRICSRVSDAVAVCPALAYDDSRIADAMRATLTASGVTQRRFDASIGCQPIIALSSRHLTR